MIRRAVAIAAALAARPVHADPAPVALGVFVGAPGEGSGIPIGLHNLPAGVLARCALDDRDRWSTALSGGLGLPVAGAGVSLWAAFELRYRLARRLAAFGGAGLRTGFVGPGYYARHSNVFVGEAYIYSGPWTVAPRAELGVALPLGRSEIVLGGIVELPLSPSPELELGAMLGYRIRL